MITRIRHSTPVLRTLYIVGITLITTLLLLVGSILLQFPGFSLVSFAHAQESKIMAVQATSLCMSEPTDQHCTNQDPMVQGCYKDAQTIAFIEVYNPQGMHLARVERRYSPTCRTEWGRIVKDGKDIGYSYITEDQAGGIPRPLKHEELANAEKNHDNLAEQRLAPKGDGILIGVRAGTTTMGIRSDKTKGPIQ